MEPEDIEDYDREVELALFKEYRDVVGMFKHVVETERRFYLANDVKVTRHDAGAAWPRSPADRSRPGSGSRRRRSRPG